MWWIFYARAAQSLRPPERSCCSVPTLINPKQVYYNGKAVPVKDFAAYVDMYLGPKETGPPRFYERINERWEVVVSLSDGQFQQVSFVNSICTSKGGTHVTAVESQVTKSLMELMAKKHKQVGLEGRGCTLMYICAHGHIHICIHPIPSFLPPPILPRPRSRRTW